MIWTLIFSLFAVLDQEGEEVQGVLEALLVPVGVAVGVNGPLIVAVPEALSLAVGVAVVLREELQVEEGVLLGVGEGVNVGSLVVDGPGAVLVGDGVSDGV